MNEKDGLKEKYTTILHVNCVVRLSDDYFLYKLQNESDYLYVYSFNDEIIVEIFDMKYLSAENEKSDWNVLKIDGNYVFGLNEKMDIWYFDVETYVKHDEIYIFKKHFPQFQFVKYQNISFKFE